MKIPATVITGFLGAGKTTLIRHLLANAGGRRIALVINEFGDLGVDGGVIKGCEIAGCSDEDVIELANGCICCTVADDFLPTMEKLLDRPRPPDHIVIETSGLALPKPLVKAFTWPEIRARMTVDGVIAVVDAAAVAAGRFAPETGAGPAPDHDSPLEEVFEEQLSAADMVLLNKADLVDQPTLDAVKARVLEELPRAVKVVATDHGRIDADVLLGLMAGAEDDLDARPSHHDGEDDHDHDDFESFVVEMNPGTDPDALARRVAETAEIHDILRVKGFLAVDGKARRYLLQGVGARIDGYFDRPWGDGEPRRGRLVVIGRKGLDRDAVERALRA